MSLVLDAAAQDLLFREARTANTFTDEPVSEEQVQAIYDLVKYAPTAMNAQPLRITFVRSPEARERLVGHMAEGNKAKTASAPLVAIVGYDTDWHEELPKVFPHAPGAKENFDNAAEVRHGMGSFNASLQIGYLIIAIRAAGLAAGPMAGYDAEGVNKDFFGDGAHKVLAVINIGRPGPDAWFPRSPRLEYDEVVTTV
ncbi:3-hydroxypropanoate dehydrogenase [Actinocorallia herbida]|uniref:3-hydroxypropanoate dehydrogenase n=1 Tax=Actinocorallia herbida TaxID=58109 RepID=A0A3N1D5U1_9ACTN|nr:malonic semialdehyde reductase [Actinocorallia herbida]ROO88915.1 3-hydroxypropanoate dehydrogenase [Actinocorallia herbida]